MQGLLYGVRGDRGTPPDESTRLMRGLSRTPMRLEELERPKLLRDDWCVAKTRLTGICGSDAKMVFMDFGDDFGDDGELNGFLTFPTVFGHEAVADVVEVGPAVTTIEVGQRVVLNPWLSSAPTSLVPPRPSCHAGHSTLGPPAGPAASTRPAPRARRVTTACAGILRRDPWRRPSTPGHRGTRPV